MIGVSAIKKMIYQCTYKCYDVFNAKNRKVLIKSEASSLIYQQRAIPVRKFTALSWVKMQMGRADVMMGRFEEKSQQYCVSYNLFVHPLYRHRAIATKLVLSHINFCRKEGFQNLIAIIRKDNAASIDLYRKCGFTFLIESEQNTWMSKEAKLYNSMVLVAHYSL